MLNRSTRRVVGGLALALGLVGLAVPAANAVVLGDLYITPTSGTVADGQYPVVETHQACPDGTANVKVSVTGSGINDTSANNLKGLTGLSGTESNSFGGVKVTADITLKEIFQAYGILHPAGEYTLSLRCQNGTGSTVYGDYVGKINLTAGANNFEGTYTYVEPTGSGAPTTTTLSAPAAVKAGAATTLTATVTAGAAGTVQFKDGGANVGAPVPVSGGVATLATATFAAGNHSLTAAFTSSDTNAFQNSVSTPAAALASVGVPSVGGTVQVGRTITCNVTTGGTPAYAWLVNNAVASTAKSVVAPGTWYGKSVQCRATVSGVAQVSGIKKLALGSKLVYKTRPKVLGIAKVGKLLTCSPGVWSPAASSYRYQWFRGLKAISGKTARTYRTVRADKGKPLTCRVTTVKTGYAAGVAKAPARKIL